VVVHICPDSGDAQSQQEWFERTGGRQMSFVVEIYLMDLAMPARISIPQLHCPGNLLGCWRPHMHRLICQLPCGWLRSLPDSSFSDDQQWNLETT
jgi:hypothetical protein